MKIRRNVRKQNHMCVDVQGALNHYQRSRKKTTPFTDDEGRPLNRWQVIAELQNYLSDGKRVIPMGECYRFCYQKGCKGHIISLNPPEDKQQEIEREYLHHKSKNQLPV